MGTHGHFTELFLGVCQNVVEWLLAGTEHYFSIPTIVSQSCVEGVVMCRVLTVWASPKSAVIIFIRTDLFDPANNRHE